MTFVNLRYVEECTAEELSLDGIRKRAEAFNHTFEHNGGYKGYEAQAIDVLLAEVEKLKSIVARRAAESSECADHGRRDCPDPCCNP